jgi:hypothetical protein
MQKGTAFTVLIVDLSTVLGFKEIMPLGSSNWPKESSLVGRDVKGENGRCDGVLDKAKEGRTEDDCPGVG